MRQRLFDTLIAARIGRMLPDALGLEALTTGGVGSIRALIATIRATEVDDIALAGCVTAGSVVIPVALLQAAEQGCDTAEFYDAIAAGYEAMIGFASAIDGPSVLYRGIWPTLASAPIGAAAVTSSLMELDVQATQNALALAIGRSAWTTDPTMSRWLQLGHAAVDGISAARAASTTIVEITELIEGWVKAAGLATDPVCFAPGEAPRIHQIDCKTFPTARQGLSAIQAFMRLHEELPCIGSDRIEIALPVIYRTMVGGTSMPVERIGSMLSAAYQMALVVHAPDRLFDVVRAPPFSSPAIIDFLSRVSVLDDEPLDAAYPGHWGARVTIINATGERRSRDMLSPEGGVDNPFGWRDLSAKASALAVGNGLRNDHFSSLQRAIEQDAPPTDVLALALA